MKKVSSLEFRNEGSTAEIMIYGVVDGSEISVKNIQEQLDSFNADQINIRINSVGGDVQEGIAIANLIKSYNIPTTAYIDSLCASIATVIALSADKVVMANNASFMIHMPVISMGDDLVTSKDLKSSVNALEAVTKAIKQTYLDKGVKVSEQKLDELMEAETWMTAEEALDMGFVDEISKPTSTKAYATTKMLNMFKNVPTTIPTEPDTNPVPAPKKEEKTLDELMKQLFSTVDEIKKQYQSQENPNQDPNEEPNQGQENVQLGNVFKAFLNYGKKEK